MFYGTGDGDIEAERVLRLEHNFFGKAKRLPISSDGTSFESPLRNVGYICANFV